MKYGPFTRLLHACIALGILLQMILTLLMRMPRPGRPRTPLQVTSFEIHEWVGLVLVGILVLHWLVFVSGHAYKGARHFFPWFSKVRMKQLGQEIRELAAMKLADPRRQDAIAGAVEGLGLLIGSLMAVSGAVLFFTLPEDGRMSASVRTLREFHEFWGPLMWGYLAIHAGAAMLHLGLGHRSVLGVFGVGDTSPQRE